MEHIFISYSSINQAEADAFNNLLLRNGIKTWMAPNDIPAGKDYAQVVLQALRSCSCVALLLTNASQNSIWVPKEIDRAIHYGKIVIPIQLEEVILNDQFEFYLCKNQIVAVRKIEEESPAVQKILRSIRTCTETSNAEVSPSVLRDEKITDPTEQYKAGYACEFGKGREVDLCKAISWYIKAANQGNVHAMYRLGVCYYYGRGVEKNPDLSFHWHKKSADLNYIPAVYAVGVCYATGIGVPQNYDTALDYYRKSADSGYHEAQYALGYSYEKGMSLPVDIEKALHFYRLAAAQGQA